MALGNTFAELNLVSQQSPRLDLSPHRRIWGGGTPVVIGPGVIGAPLVQVRLNDTLLLDDGLIIDFMFGSIGLAQTAGAVTQILSLTMGLINPTPSFIMELTTPLLTTLQPAAPVSLAFAPVPFLSARDLDAFARLRGLPSIFTPGQQPLQFRLSFAAENTGTAGTSTISPSMGIMYRLVHGLEEG